MHLFRQKTKQQHNNKTTGMKVLNDRWHKYDCVTFRNDWTNEASLVQATRTNDISVKTKTNKQTNTRCDCKRKVEFVRGNILLKRVFIFFFLSCYTRAHYREDKNTYWIYTMWSWRRKNMPGITNINTHVQVRYRVRLPSLRFGSIN